MKKIVRYALAFTMLGAAMGLQSCEDYFDLNDNPNLVPVAPLSALLSTTTHKTGLNSQRVAATTSFFVQYLASPTAGSGTDTYQVTDYTGTWDALYLAMADIFDMRKKGIEEGASDYVGEEGLEPSWISPLDPKSSASANSATHPYFRNEWREVRKEWIATPLSSLFS